MRALLAKTMVVAILAGAGAVAWRHLPSQPEAAAAVPAADPTIVASVTFAGDDLPVQTLREAVATRPGDRVDPAQLARDAEAVRLLLVERGHWAAEVTPAPVEVGLHGAHVAFAIRPGDGYRVGEITIEGVRAPRAELLRASLTVAVGDLLTAATVARNTALLDEVLARQGDRAAEVTATVTADPARRTLALVLRVAR
ncbi:MAG: hypothetical protein R2939_04040 [Kofleriaceae bacterium]